MQTLQTPRRHIRILPKIQRTSTHQRELQKNKRESRMTPKEEKVYIETKKRNLKRKLSKLSQHPDLIDEYIETRKELLTLEN